MGMSIVILKQTCLVHTKMHTSIVVLKGYLYIKWGMYLVKLKGACILSN